ncbi:MAG TPA: hypothetical protein VNY30_03915, partial [Bryobacteraceae bacterium]|nr:hypothetical protein [Bryobacteraceae bacterium]
TGSRDNNAKLWQADTGMELLTLRTHGGDVYGLAWGPCGRRLATPTGENTATVWDAETGRELLVLPTHQNYVHQIAWSPDGKRLAAGGGGIVQVYAMDIDLLMSLAHSRTTRNLTLVECRKYLHADEVPPIPFG